MQFNKEIKNLYQEGFFHVFIGEFLSKGISFISSIIIIRLLTINEYAHLSFVNNLYSYVGLFSGMGLSYSLLKYMDKKKQDYINKAYLRFTLKIGIIFQFAITAILMSYVMLSEIPFPESRTLIYFFVFMPIITYIMENLLAVIRAYQMNKTYAYLNIFQTLLIMILTIILVFSVRVYSVPIARYISLIIAISILIFVLKKTIFISDGEYILTKNQKKSILSIGFTMMVSNLFSMLMPLNELMIVSYVLTSEQVTAEFKAATLIPSQILIVTNAIMVYFFPIIAKVRENKQILSKTVRVGILNFLIVFLIVIIGWFSTELLVKILYDENYTNIIYLFRIYWIVFGINAGIRMVPMNVLPAIGRTKFNAVVSIISFIVHFVLVYLTVSNFGINQMAFVIMGIYLTTGIIYWVYLILVCVLNKDANIKITD